jgi:hypothetical protein
LPLAYRSVSRASGVNVRINIEGDAGGVWTLRREGEGWTLYAGAAPTPQAIVIMSDDTAWRLFTKGLKGGAAETRILVEGDQALGSVARGALAVLA